MPLPLRTPLKVTALREFDTERLFRHTFANIGAYIAALYRIRATPLVEEISRARTTSSILRASVNSVVHIPIPVSVKLRESPGKAGGLPFPVIGRSSSL